MTHTFKGKYQVSGCKGEISIESRSRESAKKELERQYPTFKIEKA